MAEIRADQLGVRFIHIVQIADQIADFIEAIQEDRVGLPVPAEEIAIDGVEVFFAFFVGQRHDAFGDTFGPRHDSRCRRADFRGDREWA